MLKQLQKLAEKRGNHELGYVTTNSRTNRLLSIYRNRFKYYLPKKI